MNLSNRLTQWRACILGAINGVIYGCISEVIHYIYIQPRLMEQYRQLFESSFSSTTIPHDPLLFPLIFIFTFTVASYLAHKLLLNRMNSILLLWQIIGVASVGIFILLYFINRPHQPSFELSLMGITYLGMVIPVNFIYGGILQMSARYYSDETKVNLP